MNYDALERLVKLRDIGALTDAEFAQQKAILLSRRYDTEAQKIGERPKAPTAVRKALPPAALALSLLGALSLLWFSGTKDSGLAATASPEEMLCQASIKASLINPETVEFFEFSPTSAKAYLESYEADLRESLEAQISSSAVGSGLTGVYADAMASSTRSIIDENVSKAVNDHQQLMQSRGLKTFSYRIKAQGRLGNLITQIRQCAVNSTDCDCIPPAD